MKRVGIVILSFNNSIDTIECIKSLEAIERGDYELDIVVVDNSNDSKYASEITQNCSGIDNLIRCVNNGYSAGNNEGIKKALLDGCEFVVVLNNDTIVEKGFLFPLINELENNENQIVAPVILNYYSNKVWSSGGRKRLLLGDFCMSYDTIHDKQSTDFITGCCFATTKSVFEKVGLLNEDYFMYCEDTDFCVRAKKANCDLKILPNSIIYHKVGVSSGKNSAFQLYYIYRNRIYFCYSHFRGIYKFYAVLINKIRALIKSFAYALKKEKEKSTALRLAIKDGKNIKGIRRY